jgi:hypothetical protein
MNMIPMRKQTARMFPRKQKRQITVLKAAQRAEQRMFLQGGLQGTERRIGVSYEEDTDA